MAVVFRELTINVTPTPGRKRRESATAVFGGRVLRAQAVLKGFSIRRNTDDDREILAQQVNIDVIDIINNAVTVAADFMLHDSAGNIDGHYNGLVRAVVIAEVA